MTGPSIAISLRGGPVTADILHAPEDGAFINVHLGDGVSMYLTGWDADAVLEARTLAGVLLETANRLEAQLAAAESKPLFPEPEVA